MLTKKDIIVEAQKLHFKDIGFTSAEPFDSQKDVLLSRQKEYQWVTEAGMDLIAGIEPKNSLPDAKSIIVLIEHYFRRSFPPSMEAHFGRCYLDDDRVTKDGLALRVKSFRAFLRENGIDSKVPFHLPHRLAAARAGLGTFGKNCLFYSRKAARQGSWVLPIAIVVNHKFAPDTPTIEVGCPDWCKNTCLVACPTGALKGPRHINPQRCISYLSYYGQGITPMELREPMGLWVYGCDRCQNVCPRNAPWLANQLPLNKKVVAKAKAFDLSRLLHMDKDYFESKIWPHMFYMSSDNMWRWKMNVARVMGNSLDPKYISDLVQAFIENKDDRIKGMIAWALGRIGSDEAKNALEQFLGESDGLVHEEILLALKKC
jgi:epoxyqueuosine reductase